MWHSRFGNDAFNFRNAGRSTCPNMFPNNSVIFLKKIKNLKRSRPKMKQKEKAKRCLSLFISSSENKAKILKMSSLWIRFGTWEKICNPPPPKKSLIVHKYSKDRHSTDWLNGVNQKICFHCCIKLTTLKIITVTQAQKSAIHWTPSPNGHPLQMDTILWGP